MYPGKGTVVLIRPAQTFYERINLTAPDESAGLYYAWVHQIKPFNQMALFYTVLASSMGALNDNLALHIPNYRLPYHQSDLPAYRKSRVNLVFDTDVEDETNFQALNEAEGYGLLRVMDEDDHPRPRDIAIYETLPNELPRVAGIVSTVQQTPLSHVNLRAVQDGVPNAYIRNAVQENDIASLIGSHVHYIVTEDGYTIRAATRLNEILGLNVEDFEALATFSAEQRAYLKALANIGGGGPHSSNDIERLAASTYGVTFNEKNLPKQVLYPLEKAQYITLQRGTKQSGRGAKPFLNQYQGGMCISGVLKTAERTTRHLISPLGPNWVGTDIAV